MAHIAVKERATPKAKGRSKPEGAKRSSKGASKATTTTKATPDKVASDIDALRVAVEHASSRVETANTEAAKLRAQADSLVAEAKAAYRTALIPYRDACRRAGARCDFARTRTSNVSERVTFLVEKAPGGVTVTVKGRPETAETIPAAKLRVSIGKCAQHYCERWIGERSRVGNKQGTLSNRLRAVLKEKGK
jgi:hypothetical protein